jgi:hypothetical protein
LSKIAWIKGGNDKKMNPGWNADERDHSKHLGNTSVE